MECTPVRCAKSCLAWITMEVVFICAFSVALCGASLVKTPSNKAVIAGQRMEMECRTDNSSMFRLWDFLKVGGDTPRIIAINDSRNIVIVSNISRYGIHSDQKGSIILYSNPAESTDAGIYTCRGKTGSTEFQYSAQLVVLESAPSCDTNMTADTSLAVGDYIWMQCRVNFRGNWAPTMEWRQHVNADRPIDEGHLVSNMTDTVVIQNSSITSTLIVHVNSTNYDSYYSCGTYFIWHTGRLTTTATNVPDFNHTCTVKKTLSDLSTITTLADTNDRSTTVQIKTDLVFLLFGVLSAAFLLMMVATIAICCIIIRRKTAELRPKVVSNYENRERPQSARNSVRFSTGTFGRHRRTLSRDEVERPEQEPYEGYTSVDDLTEECSQAIGERPTASEIPQYKAVFKNKNKPSASAADAVKHYSLAKEEDALYYATLRKNIEPPNWRTDHDSADSDSESEDLK